LLRQVLEKVGFRYPETSLGSILAFLFHRLRIRLRGLHFRECDESQIAPRQLFRIDTCWAVSLGLSMIDTIRGRDFQGQHLLLALRAGEPYRVSRALANEAGYSATKGPSASAYTADVLGRAVRLADKVGRPQAIAIAQVAIGITAHGEGRWKEAWERALQGESILRERCTGVAWELDTTHIYSLRALFYLGEIAEMAKRLPLLVREAEARDDQFAEISLRTRHSYVVWLGKDEPRLAREELLQAIARWSQRSFYMQHYWALVSEADIALYAGEPEAALRIVRERTPALRRSRLLRVHHIRIEWLHLRARSALAVAARSAATSVDAEPLLAAAEADAKRIESERVAWGDGLASLLRAGVASVRNDRAQALERLEFSQRAFDGSNMALYAAVTRSRKAEILGGQEGAGLAAEVGAWMATQRVRRPEGFARMLAPGRWGNGEGEKETES